MSGSNQINTVQVFNQTMPKGSVIKTIPQKPVLLVGVPFTIDLSLAQQNGIIDQIQSCWIDNSQGSGSLTINCGASGQSVTIPPGWQGFVPLLVSNPPVFLLTASANLTPSLLLINVPMPVGIWPSVGSPPGAAFADWSVAFDAASAITLLIPANPARRYLYIEPAPGVDMFIAVNGLPGTSPPSVGWLELNGATDPSHFYQSGGVASTGAVYYYDAAGNNVITAYEA